MGTLLYGTLSFGLGYALAYFGLVEIQAGMASVVLAVVPMATFLLAWAQRLEPFTWRALSGAAIAAAGIAIVFRDQVSADVPLLSLGALLGAALAFAQSGIVVKRFPRVDVFAMNAVGMAVGAAFLLALSVAGGETRALPALKETWFAFVYLVLVGSFALFFLVLYVIHRWTASGVAYQFVLSPIITVAVGFWLADERVTPAFLAGALVVLAGVYVGALARGPSHPPASPGGPSP